MSKVTSQIILAVDDNGNFLDYIPKEEGHSGKGRRHLAITVLLFNSKGQVLLQRRKHQVFDNIWDFTASTHPLHKPHVCHPERSEGYNLYPSLIAQVRFNRTQDDRKCKICGEADVDESLEEAAYRCLEVEYGIDEKIPLKNLGFFNYFAPYHTVGGEYCENEHDALLIGEYNGEIKLNSEIAYEYKWEDEKEMFSDMEKNPQKYSPWANEGVRLLKKMGV